MVPDLSDFLGDWRLARRITDRLAAAGGPIHGRFDGRAAFVLADGGLAYAETGLLRLGRGAPLTATRRYHWRREGAEIAVDHGGGAPFHRFRPNAPAARHLCGADLYCVRYDFSDWPRWSAAWKVRGPRKDYELMSIYTREGEA